MSFTLRQINPGEVDGGDLTFVVSYGFDLARLQASLEALGLISPPLLRLRQDGRYQIVCGYQRFLAVTQLGWPELPALLVPAETPAVWCLQASLHETVSGRGFNPMEAALMIERLLRYFAEDTVRRRYLPLLGLPPSLPHLRKVQSLLQLEAPWQELAAHNRLSTEAAAVLSQWTEPERGALLPWFHSLQFSHSKQLELLELLTTLSRRAGNSPAAWLERPELVSLLADPVLTRSEKSNRLWETLRHWCFPRASQAQQQFQHYLKALGLAQHPEMRLIPAPAFEDSSLKLELRFHDKSQLARHLQQVQEMLDQPEFEALLKL
jgi:ParB family transcriptional regulator, chromosome partitioning protein